MNTLWLIPIAVGWLACGVVTAGYWYAYFQREFPNIAAEQERVDWWSAMGSIAFGPIGFANLIWRDNRRHGWSLNRNHHKLMALDKLVNGGR